MALVSASVQHKSVCAQLPFGDEVIQAGVVVMTDPEIEALFLRRFGNRNDTRDAHAPTSSGINRECIICILKYIVKFINKAMVTTGGQVWVRSATTQR